MSNTSLPCPSTSVALARTIFPEYLSLPSLSELEYRYPARRNEVVTRVGPSPTGFMHLGGLYVGLINYLFAKRKAGTFFLRVEDTDAARYVPEALETIVDAFSPFSFQADEGLARLPSGHIAEIGEYGPYVQSKRSTIYKTVLFDFICRGHAYPCFMSEAELEEIRQGQLAQHVRPGIYGDYARFRDFDPLQAIERIKRGDSYTIRLRAPRVTAEGAVQWHDLIRGSLSLPANDTDVVLMKSDGMPVYHFAHLVDDHYMRTTHVIRADEWISSVPLHLQLFSLAGWPAPQYGHIAPIQKLEGTSRRKLSKRKDPEADVRYYHQHGYPPEGVIAYLLSLANSDFEAWYNENRHRTWQEFPFALDKLNNSGALLDTVKLQHICRDIYAAMEHGELVRRVLAWAKRYPTPLGELFIKYPEYTAQVLAIDKREGRGAKRLGCFADLPEIVGAFFDELLPPVAASPFPTHVTAEDRAGILREVADTYDDALDPAQVFAYMQPIAARHGFASSVKEHRADPQRFKGHVGDVAMVIRVALFGSTKSPDLGLAMTTMGAERVRRRCRRVIAGLSHPKP